MWVTLKANEANLKIQNEFFQTVTLVPTQSTEAVTFDVDCLSSTDNKVSHLSVSFIKACILFASNELATFVLLIFI